MFKNEDFERLLVKYTTQGIPAGESIQHFCDRNKVPYNLFDKWYRDTRHKVVRVTVDGIPDEGAQDKEDNSLMGSIIEEIRPQKTPVAERKEKTGSEGPNEQAPASRTRIMIDLRTTEGLQIRRRGMTYTQFLEFAKKLSTLC